MNIKYFLFVFIVMGVVFVAVFTDSKPENKTYTEENITFSYPGDWKLDEDGVIHTTNDDGIVTLLNRGTFKEIAAGTSAKPTFEEVVEYENSTEFNYISSEKKEINIAGTKGIEYIYKYPKGHVISVYFAKGDTLYSLDLITKNYETDKEGFETIKETLKFK